MRNMWDCISGRAVSLPPGRVVLPTPIRPLAYAFPPGLALIALHIFSPCEARGDHALVQDGTAVFNVRVDAIGSTESRPLRVRYGPGSFGYDFQHDRVTLTPQVSDVLPIADYITTSVRIGKREARRLMQSRGWDDYAPPPPVQIVLPTPGPPVPVMPIHPAATPAPADVASATLSPEDRLARQRDIFLAQQQAMVAYLKAFPVSHDEGIKTRVGLLQSQVKVLQSYFPKDDDEVRRASEALTNHEDFVTKTGRFIGEN